MSSSSTDHPIAIIGGGLAGLAAATVLHQANVPFVLLEQQQQLGGRVQSEEVNGFILDRGFQVFTTSYPHAQQLFDYKALGLYPFKSGAYFWQGEEQQFDCLLDPIRHPLQALDSLLSPIGSFKDKLLTLRLRNTTTRRPHYKLLRWEEKPSVDFLLQRGFSTEYIHQFFKPFYGGVFLEPGLSTSSRKLAFTFKCFAEGSATLPTGGMTRLAEQLSTGLPPENLRTNFSVQHIDKPNGIITLKDGDQLQTTGIVIATNPQKAFELVGQGPTRHTEHSAITLYFAAPNLEWAKPALYLNARDNNEKDSINLVCFPSVVNPSYAPTDQTLVCVSLKQAPPTTPEEWPSRIQMELVQWFGNEAKDWHFLKQYVINEAISATTTSFGKDKRLLQQWQQSVESPQLRVAGDYLTTASIDGALESGIAAAKLLLAQRKETLLANSRPAVQVAQHG